jgi:hypothetical protein
MQTQSDNISTGEQRARRRKRTFPTLLSFIIFEVVFVLFSYMYNYHEVLSYRPDGVHQWRQTDCLSFTDRMYRGESNFGSTAIAFLGHEGSGKTVSEFPILYWMNAIIWKITGKQEWTYRLLVLLLFHIGLFALFKTAEGILKDSLWAFITTFGLFTSPFLAYYANNFLADVPAFSLVLMAWYFVYRFYKKRQVSSLYIIGFLFLFAGLLKATAALSLIALMISFLLRAGPISIMTWQTEDTWKPYAKRIWAIFGILCIAWIAWYSYARSYNQEHNKDIFLIGILPIWEVTYAQANEILFHVGNTWWHHFFRPILHAVLWGLFLIMLLSLRGVPAFFRSILLTVSLGFVSFFLLYFQVFDQHDYYALNLLILYPCIVIGFLLYVKQKRKSVFRALPIQFLSVLLLMHCADFTRRRMLSRYEMNPITHTGVFFEIEPWLRAQGVQRTDKIISIPDKSPNISLYLSGSIGWSQFADFKVAEDIDRKIASGAKYLMYQSSAGQLPDSLWQPYVGDIVGKYQDPKYPDQIVYLWQLQSSKPN